MTVYLLDINLLLAMGDPRHVHHDVAHRWFAKIPHRAWATCALTENGFVRIASHPVYPNSPGSVAAVLEILRRLRESPDHVFWTEDIGLLEILDPEALVPHSQITDLYLLGLAVQKSGKLATLDQRIRVEAVQGGLEALELVSA